MTLMDFNQLSDRITWRIHFRSPPEKVFGFLATSAGRASFWAESAVSDGKTIQWVFPNGIQATTRILRAKPVTEFELEYLGGSRARFTLEADGEGGTDLELTDTGIDPAYVIEVAAGWVSVLMAMKAAVDFGVDLRNHDPTRTWDQGYAEN